MRIFSCLILILLLVFSCTLSASQEQELNKQTGVYLDAVEKNTSLLVIAKTHPAFVRYARDKGTDYFKTVFDASNQEQIVFSNPVMKEVKISEKGEIHVLYEIEKEYFDSGETKDATVKLVAISEDDGKTWFFLEYPLYRNRSICKDIPRLIN